MGEARSSGSNHVAAAAFDTDAEAILNLVQRRRARGKEKLGLRFAAEAFVLDALQQI